jgi:hypothetical protein
VTDPYVYARRAFCARQKKRISDHLPATLGLLSIWIAARTHAQPLTIADWLILRGADDNRRARDPGRHNCELLCWLRKPFCDPEFQAESITRRAGTITHEVSLRHPESAQSWRCD